MSLSGTRTLNLFTVLLPIFKDVFRPIVHKCTLMNLYVETHYINSYSHFKKKLPISNNKPEDDRSLTVLNKNTYNCNVNSKDRQLLEQINSSLKILHESYSENEFVEPTIITRQLVEHRQIVNKTYKRINSFIFKLGFGNKELKNKGIELISFYEEIDKKWRTHNIQLAKIIASKIKNDINPVEGNDLDLQQLSSIVMDVSNRLVLAGAGSGKTTTIVGLVKYLISKNVDPN